MLYDQYGPGFAATCCRLIICALLFLPINMSSYADDTAPVADDSDSVVYQPRSIDDYSRPPGRGLLNMFLPLDPPLPREEVDRWANILGASEAQAHFIALEYQRFLDVMNERMDQLIPAHLDASAALYELQEEFGTRSPEFFEAMKAHNQDHNRVVRQLREVERTFIESLRPVLTHEQASRLDVLHARAERYWNDLDLLPTRGIGIDLYAVWLDMDHVDVGADIVGEVATILAAHESNLTALYQQVERGRQEHLISFRRNMLRALDGQITPEEYNSAYNRGRERRVELGRRIRNQIVATTQRIQTLLPEGAAVKWNARVQANIFPELYPDPTSLDELLTAIAADSSIYTRQSRFIDAIREEYTLAIQRFHAGLEAYIIDWGDRGTRGENGFQRQFLPAALEPNLEERKELSRRYLTKLHDHLGPEILSRHADAIPAVFRSILGENEDEQITEVDELTP